MVLEVTDKTFVNEIKGGVAITQFWAPWCGPCKMQTPVLEGSEEVYQGKIKFIKMNIDENPIISNQYGIMSIPNMQIFKDGEVVDNFIGFHQKHQVEEILNRHI